LGGKKESEMSRRQDMIAALEHRRPTECVPLWEIEFQAWDAASGQHVILGHEFEALSTTEQERAMYANAEILLSVSAEMCFAALSSPNAYWNQAPGELAYYCMPGDTRFRQLEILQELRSDDLMLISPTGGIIAANYSMEFCCRMVDDPESIDDMARNALEGAIEIAKRFRDCGAEAVMSPSDIADNSGPFFKPEYMNRWILPYLKEWSERIREMGMYTILHSDGNLTQYMDEIAATGLDAIQAVDPVAGMEMRQTKDAVSERLCLCGNIDCGLLLRGSPDETYEATKNLLNTCKDGGGLVLGTSNAVQPEVPIENYRAMITAWKEYGRYDDGSMDSSNKPYASDS
jgi:uroporphyrinogen decarboxylase